MNNYKNTKKTPKGHHKVRVGTQERINFEEGSLPKAGLEMLLLAKVWLQLAGWWRSSLGLVHAGWAAGNNPLGAKQEGTNGSCREGAGHPCLLA